jgi:hypothetical protein
VNDTSQTGSPFGVLRQFVRRPSVLETCEICSKELAANHQHLLELARRKLICACDACAILFGGQSQLKYKRVPRRVRFLENFQLTDSQWDGLMMPINMAFFFKSAKSTQPFRQTDQRTVDTGGLGVPVLRGLPEQHRVIALYPSPAGATESLLSLDTWDEIEFANPVLQNMEPDVEALLVNRIGHARGFSNPEYYIVPIDECFKLVGLIRSRWQGLSGGAEVWRQIGEFFSGLKERSPRVAEQSHA